MHFSYTSWRHRRIPDPPTTFSWLHFWRKTVRSQIKPRIQSLFKELKTDYDFRRFELDDFREWVVHRQQRPIEFVPISFASTVFGGCVRGAKTDYAFYDSTVLPLLQVHTQLHELSHLLCGHGIIDSTISDERALLEEIFFQFSDMVSHPDEEPDSHSAILFRSRQNTPEEMEAELLSEFIVSKVAAHRRYELLKKPITFSQSAFEVYEAMGLS